MTDSARLATRRDVGGSRSLWTALAVMLLTGAAVFAAGCSDDGGNSRLQRKSVSTEASREQLFRVAIENLNRLDEFNSPTMLRNIVDRLNDWSQAQPEVDYELPEFFAQLPPNVQRLAEVQSLGSARFDSRFDERHLQETIWLRDIADRTCGDQIDDVTRARELFDWTVRNSSRRPRRCEFAIPTRWNSMHRRTCADRRG